MFCIFEIEDYVRVEPKLFGLATKDAVFQQLRESYADYQDKEVGDVVGVVDVLSVGEGIIIPGDGAAYYNTRFKLIAWKPEMQELAYGIINEITNFGAFINLGVAQGMIHISQAMDDYVSFSKSNTLTGKANKRSLKKGDLCIARIVAISYKGDEPKIGLTMRQPGLGKLEWIKEDKRKAQQAIKKAEVPEEGDKKRRKKNYREKRKK